MVGSNRGQAVKIKHCLHCGEEIPPDAGGYQAHRKMYCSLQCKDCATKARQRLRAKGLLPAYETTTAKTQKKECPICRIEFEGSKDRRYCSDKCREEGHRRRDRARKAAKAYQNELSGSAGSWGLETDPWKTGQLPAEIRRNALWA